MKIQKAIVTETLRIASGVLIADAVMCLVFALLGHFSYTVVLGALWGSAFAVGNFFLMGLAVQKAVTLGEGAKRYMQRNYALRMLFCLVGMALGVALPCFHSVAALVPFLVPKLVIYAVRLLGLSKADSSASTEGGDNKE